MDDIVVSKQFLLIECIHRLGTHDRICHIWCMWFIFVNKSRLAYPFLMKIVRCTPLKSNLRFKKKKSFFMQKSWCLMDRNYQYCGWISIKWIEMNFLSCFFFMLYLGKSVIIFFTTLLDIVFVWCLQTGNDNWYKESYNGWNRIEKPQKSENLPNHKLYNKIIRVGNPANRTMYKCLFLYQWFRALFPKT